jgi:hypothetical protein
MTILPPRPVLPAAARSIEPIGGRELRLVGGEIETRAPALAKAGAEHVPLS